MFNKISKNDARLKRHIRVRGKISGTALCPRVCVYRSNKHIEVQIIDDVKGATLVSTSSVVLGINGANIEGAKLVGVEIAKLAVAHKIVEVVFDRSGYLYHGRVAALADAMRAAGLKF